MLDHAAPAADTARDEAEETQRLIRESAAAFVQRVGGSVHVRATRGRDPAFDRAVWTEMGEAGWFGLHLPEDLGGQGMGCGGLAALMEEVGRGLMPEPVGAAGVLALGLAARSPRSEARDAALTAATQGSELLAPALLEAPGAYDALPETRLDGGCLTGRKRFVIPGKGADRLIVSARSQDRPVLALVAADAAGVTWRPQVGVDAGWMAEVTFEAAPATLLAEGDAAAVALTQSLDEATLAAAAELLGVMRAALDMTLDYTRNRSQFSKPIGSFQALQHRMVDMWAQSELAAASVAQAAMALDAGRPEASAEVSAAKARANEAAAFITRQAIQLFGGMGYTDECDIGLHTKRALALAAFAGNTTYHRRRYLALTRDLVED